MKSVHFRLFKKIYLLYLCRKSTEIPRFLGQIRNSDFFQKCMITAPTCKYVARNPPFGTRSSEYWPKNALYATRSYKFFSRSSSYETRSLEISSRNPLCDVRSKYLTRNLSYGTRPPKFGSRIKLSCSRVSR